MTPVSFRLSRSMEAHPMKKTISAVTLTLFALGSAFAFRRAHQASSAPPTPTAAKAPAEPSRGRPESTLTEALVAPPRKVPPPALSTEPPPPERRQEPVATTTDESAPAAAAMEPEEIRFQMSSRFEEERPDRAWAATAQELIRTRLIPHLAAGSKLISVQCRASMCEVLSSHTGPDAYNQFLQAAFRDPESRPWNTAVFATPTSDRDRDGNVITVAYLSREGQELPNVSTE